MRVKHLLRLVPLAGLLAGSLAMAPAATESTEPDDRGPIGVCAHVPRAYPDPICVLVDLDG